MGFFNFRDHVWACGFDTRDHDDDGNVALISQSGSGMCGIVDVDERLRFAYAVSTGQELSVGLPDYLDYVLRDEGVRAIGLFMETARDPGGLLNALGLANDPQRADRGDQDGSQCSWAPH